jgi:phage tail sheath protein FI
MSDGTGGAESRGDGIFAAFHELTIKSLEQSLIDARARYEQGEAVTDPGPSLNWAVTNQAVAGEDGSPPSLEQLLQEEVVLWLNVGDERLEIVPGSDHANIQASALINALQEMKGMVEAFSADRTSELATLFHQTAITQAKPLNPPEEEGMTGWEYDATVDRYTPV